MKVFAVLFRLLSLLLPIALATYLWMESEVLTERSESFLDEVVSDAYSILQADKKSLWDELNSKKAAFDEAFEWLREIRSTISEHDSVERYMQAGVDVFLGTANFYER